MCATDFSTATEMARRYRETAIRMKSDLPGALTAGGIEAAWRQYAKENLEIVPYRDEFMRVARGEE